jgi:hypothetical protein
MDTVIQHRAELFATTATSTAGNSMAPPGNTITRLANLSIDRYIASAKTRTAGKASAK